MDVLLVYNARAGAVVGEKALKQIVKSAGYRVRLTSSRKEWTTALQHEPDLVVAAGGDGTVRKVALGVAGSGTPFAVLPFGTANNVGKSLGVTGNLEELVASWRTTAPLPFDVGTIVCRDEHSRFVESMGAGLFADLIERGRRDVEKHPAYVGPEIDRALHLFGELANNARAQPWTVVIDGIDRSGDYVGVEVMNLRFAGPNVPLAPEADPGDGLFDVALIDEPSRRALIAYARDRLSFASAALPGVTVVRGRSIDLTPPLGALIHLDDRLLDELDPARAAAIQITVDAGACRVIPRAASSR